MSDPHQPVIEALRSIWPQADPSNLAQMADQLLHGQPATLGTSTASLTFGQDNDFSNATITVGTIAGRDVNTTNLTINIPQTLDPLPVARAVFASLPLDHLPPPTTELPPHSRMLFGRNPQFVGRERDIMNLAVAIANPAPTVIVAAVATGVGGIGKTSVAVEFAYRYGRYFQGGVFWLNCADPAVIPGEIAACAVALDLPVGGLPLGEQMAAVKRAWQDPIPRLVIFDNCEDPKVLDQWKPTVGGCRVLVTARRAAWRDADCVPLATLARDNSVALLQRLCPRLTAAEAGPLAEDLGDLPLALHLAGSYLETYDHVTVAAYRTQLSLAHPSLRGRGTDALPTRRERDVERTFALSYDQLDPANEIDALAAWLLACAAWCAHGVPIPRELLLTMLPEGLALEAEDAIDALARLRTLGLLDGQSVLVLHRLLASYVQQQVASPPTMAPSRPRLRKRANQALDRVDAVLASYVQPQPASTTQAVVERALIAQAARINSAGLPTAMAPILPHLRERARQALDRVDAQASDLLDPLAYHLHIMGDYAGARPLLERALAIREAALGPDHPDTARSMHYLANLLSDLEEYAAARPLYERALAIREAALGPDHHATASTLNSLAKLISDLEEYAAARPLYERALAIREATLGPEHPDTASIVGNLGILLRDMGDFAGARPLYERALAIREVALGPNHPDTARTLNALASLLRDTGEYDSARPLYEWGLAIREATLGPNHPDTATSLNSLASLLRDTGEYQEAKPLFERALAIREAVLGPNHSQTRRTRDNLALVLAALGQAAPQGEKG
jgi:tetratricopeptide (TPR) repeat protein